jgi:enamine deaminase RidA (YjgF/YER057c/UK114 family)
MTDAIEKRLAELGIELPPAPAPAAAYVPFVRSGNQLYVSGQIPISGGAISHKGLVGRDVPLEDAQAAARLCAINLLAQAKAACGRLDGIKRVVKLGGFVACGPDFGDHPKVINGASELMVEVFGEAGRHARFAVGAASLPFGASVEVEAIFEVA